MADHEDAIDWNGWDTRLSYSPWCVARGEPGGAWGDLATEVKTARLLSDEELNVVMTKQLGGDPWSGTPISAALTLGANAIGLLVAAAVLDDMSLNGAAFFIAVIIFTVVEVVAQPFLVKVTMKNARRAGRRTGGHHLPWAAHHRCRIRRSHHRRCLDRALATLIVWIC